MKSEQAALPNPCLEEEEEEEEEVALNKCHHGAGSSLKSSHLFRRQEIPRLHGKIHHRVSKTTALGSTLSHTNSVHSIAPDYSKFSFNIIISCTHICPN
jgi:hypothetical protein